MTINSIEITDKSLTDLHQIFKDFEGKSAASFFYKNKKSDHSAACR